MIAHIKRITRPVPLIVSDLNKTRCTLCLHCEIKALPYLFRKAEARRPKVEEWAHHFQRDYNRRA